MNEGASEVQAPAGVPAGASLDWSRYNRLFSSRRYGWFLYNAVSNELLKLDDAHRRALEALRGASAGGGGAAAFAALTAAEPAFAARLREAGVLVVPGEEEGRRLAARYQRHAAHFATSTLGLTVCPTLACNFRCGYCFEHSQSDGLTMSAETVDGLLAFIASHEGLRRVSLAWYGGEPTLAWDVVREVTRRVHEAGFDDLGAGLVTNGYLLDAAKVEELADLDIVSVQITLDGPREVHDRRRVLAGGGPTFARILANVDTLMDSGWRGRCSIRVNVDRRNQDLFTTLRAELLERYDGRHLSVYAGHVHTPPQDTAHAGCGLDVPAWADYTLGLYAGAGLLPVRGFYPTAAPPGCVANAHQGWVVGPGGELYKCWEDVGTADMAVGSVHAGGFVTDPELRARYALGTDPDNDPACRDCDVLPICNGGCANKRLRALQFGEQGLEYCPPYKYRLEEYLEAYYDAVLTRELCAAVLAPGRPERDVAGWRVLTPDPATLKAPRPLDGPADRED